MKFVLFLIGTLVLASSCSQTASADDRRDGAPLAEKSADLSNLRTLQLKYVGAESARSTLVLVFPWADQLIKADPTKNVLFVLAPQDKQAQLGVVLQLIDRPTAASGPKLFEALKPGANVGRPVPVASSGLVSARADDPFSPNVLRGSVGLVQRDRAPANSAAQIAADLRTLRQLHGGAAPSSGGLAAGGGFGGGGGAEMRAGNQAGLKSETELIIALRHELTQEFETRQTAQSAELDQLRQRLKGIEERVANRERNKNQIIDRRVQELLNPELQWEPSSARAMAESVPTPASTANAWYAARFAKTKNNLKRLALACHNYHDVHQSFPPAVVMGPDGKTPHSWRVELLPFLDQDKLYRQYRMDEPWDGPNNKKLIERMPNVFRSPFDNPKSTNSGYYALIGPGTAFDVGTKGVQVRDFIDGTSNTILLVEAARNIPWTKPEDIPFDGDKFDPEKSDLALGFVGTQFATALADGSVRIIDREKVKDILKWMILRNDIHPITIPSEEMRGFRR